MKQVVFFTIEWFGGYFSPDGEICHDSTSVYREQRKIIYHADYKNSFEHNEEFLITKYSCDLIFKCIDDADNKKMFNKKDYRVRVCDGSAWQMNVYYSDNTKKTIHGNVEYPDFGEKLEQYIINAIINRTDIEHLVTIEPHLFLGYPYFDDDDEDDEDF